MYLFGEDFFFCINKNKYKKKWGENMFYSADDKKGMILGCHETF